MISTVRQAARERMSLTAVRTASSKRSITQTRRSVAGTASSTASRTPSEIPFAVRSAGHGAITDPLRHVFYSGNQSGTSNAAQASSSGVLLNILKIAGLGQDKNIKPHSIRFGGVCTRLHGTPETHPVQAAKALGLSLSASMRYLDLSL